MVRVSRIRIGVSGFGSGRFTHCYGGRNFQLGRRRCFLTCHRSGGSGSVGKYRSVSRLGLLIGNRWMSRLVVLECANCSLHVTMEGALSETATVSLSTVPRLSLLHAALRFASGESDVWARAGLPPTDLAVRSRSRRDQITLPK